ncbi:EAL domain-containing protein [Metabacillus litoralis]|uniref:EAL domain-containing protein n=1 Tax=Metabacillus litoralis TaxID=152268 RepID=A0A5C6VWP1_9BACI|nr:EAL domain-containing protein [Metabacillus litoralis]TXC89359.1 EAL domain-containing protein [Metabacillus litoralis]
MSHTQDLLKLSGEYSSPIVVLSIVIACCASYTALSLNQRIQHNSFFHQYFWLVLSSIAMGLGIWSMHFIGMSALELPIPMEYDLILTTISALPAILASFLAFYIASRANRNHWPYILAGITMGIGISSMHYIGMAAMKMDAEYVYKPWVFLLSIVIAIVVSYVALFIFSNSKRFIGNQYIKIITAIIMGLGIASMHYTGMLAIDIYVDHSSTMVSHEFHQMDMSLLIMVVTIGIFILLFVSALTSLLDRYVDYRLHNFDALTLLPNQRQFENSINNSNNVSGSLAIIQIHNLENLIGFHGYSLGDEIIKIVRDMIKNQIQASTSLFRIEANRFALLTYEGSKNEEVKRSLERILSSFQKPIMVGDNSIPIHTVCAVNYSTGNKNVRELFTNAMAVLLHPSISEQNKVIEYDPAVHTYSFERQIVQDINRAMTNNELFIAYQPKVCSKSMEVTGLEALLRWKHPEQGMISPGIFIPVLEDNGKIFDVTDWIIREVFKQVSIWKEASFPFSQVSINIPGAYVTSARLLNVMTKSLSEYGISSNMIELEITETSVIHDIENAISAVGKLRGMGLSVALDDFGTGLSSLSYLKRIPISTIKIDKSFVDDVPLSEKDSDILKAIITLCHSLHLKVVIEGVESKEQIDFITSVSEALHIQGYYFSRPLIEEELVTWYKNR